MYERGNADPCTSNVKSSFLQVIMLNMNVFT